MNAYQLAESDQILLLPPDCFIDKKKKYINMVESDARSWHMFQSMDTSRRTKRKYVYGSGTRIFTLNDANFEVVGDW
jgi:hypothetical protein